MTGVPAWHPHPDVWVLVAGLSVAYAWALRGSGPDRRSQPWMFAGGLVALWVAADWPVHDLSEERLLSVHMTQHLIFVFVAVPLMLAALPRQVLQRIASSGGAPLRLLAKPLPAAVLFNAVVVVSHIPAVVDRALAAHPLHFAIHALLVGTATLMWLPVLSCVPEIKRLSDPARMVYLFLQSVVPTVPASFLTFASAPLYRAYARAPRTWGVSAVADQQMAGAIMKIAGGVLLWGTIVVIFFRWYAAEQRRDRAEADGGELTWADVERELAATVPPHEP